MKIEDPSTPVLVLMSDGHGGLNIMRSLGRQDVPVYNLDPNPRAPAFHSRYCKGKFYWDIEHRAAKDSLEFLSHVRERIGRPCILIPTTDRGARFVADQDAALKNDFIFPRQRAELVRSLSSKHQMFFLARRHNIPTPEASFPKSRNQVLEFLDRAQFPIMLKGIDVQKLWDRTGKKMFIVQSKQELLERYDAAEDPRDPNLMLQEYIPGGDDTIWMFNGYFDEHSECRVAYTGKKIRQCPVHTGSTSLGICLRNDKVEELTRRFMKAVGYRGILDIGYRYDARDGQYKVLDVNPRIGATFRLFVGVNGMDVARALYLDLTGQPIIHAPTPEGRRWIVEDLDLVSSFRYHREGALPWSRWWVSLRGINEAAYFAVDDFLPVASMVVNRSLELLRRLYLSIREKLRVQFGGSAGRVSNHAIPSGNRG